MTKIDIHGTEKQKASILKRLQESDLCKENKELILKFVEHKIAAENIGLHSQRKYITSLQILAQHLKKPYDKATKEDIEKLWKKFVLWISKPPQRKIIPIFSKGFSSG